MTLQIRHSLHSSLETLSPGELPFEDPPHPIALANEIEQVVVWNLKRTIDANVRFEHQLYGADNTYLHSCFPPRRRFSVIPQAILRKVGYVPENTSPLKISVSSTGNEGFSRLSKATPIKMYPDFLIVKVIPTDSKEPRQQYICAVVEIKLSGAADSEQEEQQGGEQHAEGGEDGGAGDQVGADGAGGGEDNGVHVNDVAVGQGEVLNQDAPGGAVEERMLQGQAQMGRYMTTLMQHKYRDPKLQGFLLNGRFFQRFRIDGQKVEVEKPLDIFGRDDPLTMYFCNIAVDNWNRDDVGLPPSPIDEEFAAALGL